MLFHSFIVKFNVFFQNFNIIFSSFIQVCQFSSIVLFHSFLEKANIFLQCFILTIFPLLRHFLLLDSSELSKELKSLYNLNRNLILQVILVLKYFNFLAHPYVYVLYVRVSITIIYFILFF